MAHITKEFHSYEKALVLPIFFPWLILYSVCLKLRGSKFVKNVPNIISISRMPLAPFSAYLLYLQLANPSTLTFIAWLWLFGFLAYGDRVDGMIARNCDAISEYGKMIDAGSDKIFFISHMIPVLIGLSHIMKDFNYGVIVATTGFLFASEVLLVFLAFEGWRLKKTGHVILLGANNFGKYKFSIEIATFVISACMIFYSKAFGIPISEVSFYVVQFLLAACLAFASMSIYGHIRRNLTATSCD